MWGNCCLLGRGRAVSCLWNNLTDNSCAVQISTAGVTLQSQESTYRGRSHTTHVHVKEWWSDDEIKWEWWDEREVRMIWKGKENCTWSLEQKYIVSISIVYFYDLETAGISRKICAPSIWNLWVSLLSAHCARISLVFEAAISVRHICSMSFSAKCKSRVSSSYLKLPSSIVNIFFCLTKYSPVSLLRNCPCRLRMIYCVELQSSKMPVYNHHWRH